MATEIFRWREIRNGRQLGALVGLAPALYQSGATQRDRGITRAGNAHVRRLMVQLAWGWLRWQSDRALAQWYPPALPPADRGSGALGSLRWRGNF